MIVFVDSNVLLSFLAYPERPTAPARVVWRRLHGTDQFHLPSYVVDEVRKKARVKVYAGNRVGRHSLRRSRLAVVIFVATSAFDRAAIHP